MFLSICKNQKMISIFNPISVLSFIKERCLKRFWMETSGGGDRLIYDFISNATPEFQEQLSKFIVSEQVIVEQLDLNTFRLDNKPGSFWTYLYMTGYFNAQQEKAEKKYKLTFPNREISEIFMIQLVQWKSEFYSNEFKNKRINLNWVFIYKL